MNKRSKINSICDCYGHKCYLIDEHDNAIVGIDHDKPAVVYDRLTIIENLEKNMSEEEASEFFSFNIAYLGEGTPIFIDAI